MSDTDVTQTPSFLSDPLASVLSGSQPAAQPNYVMAPPDQAPSVPPAGPIVGMSGSPTAAAAANPPGQPNVAPPTPPAPLWQRVVMGALMGASFGAGEKTFGGGVAHGAAGVLQQKQ